MNGSGDFAVGLNTLDLYSSCSFRSENPPSLRPRRIEVRYYVRAVY